MNRAAGISMTLSVLLIANSAAGQEAGRAESPEPFPILKTTDPVKIDGVMDEPMWKRAASVRVGYVNGQVGKSSSQQRMLVHYAWDGHYLYLAYETFDNHLIAIGNGKTEGPKGNRRDGCQIYDPQQKIDVVEFFISFGDRRFFWELHHNAANQFNDAWCAVFDESWPVSKSSLYPFGIRFGHAETLQDDSANGRTFAIANRLSRSNATANGSDCEVRGRWPASNC